MEKYVKYKTFEKFNQSQRTEQIFKSDYIEHYYLFSWPQDDQLPLCLISNSIISNEVQSLEQI